MECVVSCDSPSWLVLAPRAVRRRVERTEGVQDLVDVWGLCGVATRYDRQHGSAVDLADRVRIHRAVLLFGHPLSGVRFTRPRILANDHHDLVWSARVRAVARRDGKAEDLLL